MLDGHLRSGVLGLLDKSGSSAGVAEESASGITARSLTFFVLRSLSALFLAPAVFYAFRKDQKAPGARSTWSKNFDRYSRRAIWGVAFFASIYWSELANRYAMRQSPTVLALVQSLFTVTAMLLMWPGLKIRAWADSLESLEAWFAVSVLAAASTMTLLLCFAHVSYSVVFVVECARSVFALAAETSIFGEAVHPNLWPRWLCACSGFLGGSLYLRSQVYVSRTTYTGLLLLAIHFVLSTATCLIMRYYLNIAPQRVSKALIVLTLASVASVLLVLVAPLWWSREVSPFHDRYSMWISGADDGDFQWVLLSCVAAVGLAYFGVAFQQQIGATAFLAVYAAVRATLLLGNVDPIAPTSELSIVGSAGLGIVVFAGAVGLAE